MEFPELHRLLSSQLQIRTSAPPSEIELQRFNAGPSPQRRLATENGTKMLV